MGATVQQGSPNPGVVEIAAIHAATADLDGVLWNHAIASFSEETVDGEPLQSLVLDYGTLALCRIGWAENWERLDTLAAITWEKSGVASVLVIGWDLCVRVRVMEASDRISFSRETMTGCRDSAVRM